MLCFVCHGQDKAIFHIPKLGNNIYEGVFTGNGLLGTMTYLKSSQSVRIDIGRTDIYDHREKSNKKLFDKARLSLGHFFINFDVNIDSAGGDIFLQQAFSLTNIKTSAGILQIKTTTLSEDNIILIEVIKNAYNGNYSFDWCPDSAISPRMKFDYTQKPVHYIRNPLGKSGNSNGVSFYNQELLAGGGYATVYKKVIGMDKDVYVVSVGYSQVNNSYLEETIDFVHHFDSQDINRGVKKHQDWWQNYYSASSLFLPDKLYQSFYDMQLYKLASATRADKPAMDLQGPWTSPTPWPAYWMNLNLQLAYSPVFTSNHLDIASSLIQMIDRNISNLRENVPAAYRYNSIAIGRSSANDLWSPVVLEKGVSIADASDGEKELGNLLWLLHSYYSYYRFSMREDVYDRLFPLLKEAVNYYLHLLEKNESGKYHVAVKTYSPEYKYGYAYDTNYDLAILRWGLKSLIELDHEKNKKDPLYDRWVDVLDNLIDFPQGVNGYLIAKDVPYDESHRHYSHLMMIYPFYEINWDQKENRVLIERSIKYWQSKNQYLQGYSFTGAASMYAMMGRGDAALTSLDNLLKSYIKKNTLYAESGPVIETPLAAMTSIQELCLQYWNGKLRIFPAVPTAWKDISFKRFLTDGAFLVSAKRENGITQTVEIESQHTGTIKVESGISTPMVVIKGRGKYEIDLDGIIVFTLNNGARALVYEKK
ncbi:glycosyl hydrolase family 95 catalytic domain-containing protein [Sphingobacterium faecium]